MKNETIVDRVVERLKAQPLGDLITEEDLHDIVKQAIPKAFFEERVWTEGYNTRRKPPLIVEIMSDLLKEAAQKAVAAWLDENAQVVADHWKEICDVGLLKYVREVENDIATANLRTILRSWVTQTNDERARAGLPSIFAAF